MAVEGNLADRIGPRLVAGSLTLDLAPALGGAIASFTHAGRPIFRLPHPAPVHADQLACFPLVPYSNRVRDGRFAYGGEEIVLPRNHFDPYPLHGDGWTASWRAARISDREALLVHEHESDAAWPWRYRAEQHFRLAADGLAIELGLVNRDARRFPAGLGLHPFFSRAGARLTASLTGVWRSDERRIPTRLEPVPPEWNFSQPRSVEGLDIDHCFVGWNGEAIIEWPHGALRISGGPGLDKLVIYVPPQQDYFCVEPVSNLNDGFNLRAGGVPDTGIVDLPPCAGLTIQTRFTLQGSW